MSTITDIQAHKQKLADRAKVCKDIIRKDTNPILIAAAKNYLEKQNDLAWQAFLINKAIDESFLEE